MSTENRTRAAFRVIKDMGLYDIYKGHSPSPPPPPPPRKLGKGNEAAAQASKYEYCSNHSTPWFVQLYKRKTRLKMLDITFVIQSKA